MKDIILLNTRDGSENYLKKLPGKDNVYLLVTNIDYIRVGKNDNRYTFVDPSGGPFIARSGYLNEADAMVKSIDFLEGQGFTITLE